MYIKLLVVLIAVQLTSSCKTINIKMADRSDESFVVEDLTPVENNVGDETQKKVMVKNIAVIVSSGGAHSISSVNLFKQLGDIPLNIKMISGIGWGAVPASIYASHLKANELDWQLYKLSQGNILKSSLFGQSRDEIDPDRQGAYLKKVFSNKKLSSFKAPFICPSLKGGEVVVVDRGQVSDVVNDCALLLQSSDETTDKELIYREAIYRLIHYFYKSDINTVLFVSNSDPLNQKIRTDEFILNSYKQSGVTDSDNIMISVIELNTAIVEDKYDFKLFKKIISNSNKDLKPVLKKLKNSN